MRTLSASFLLAVLVLPCAAQRTNVSVNAGSGDGSYKGQPFVHIWADPNPTGMVFDRWIGTGTELLQSSRESHTKLRTASLSAEITATYRSAPAWNATFET
jgi:hypothetical protein